MTAPHIDLKEPPVPFVLELGLDALQQEIFGWAQHNGFEGTPEWTALGVVEEMGELAHAMLKKHQNIRMDEDHDDKAKDAIGDLVVYLFHLCSEQGWDFSACVTRAWGEARERDWIKFPTNGKDH